MVGDEGCGTEEGGPVADLLFAKEEELVEGFGGDGVAEADVDREIGADFVVCSPCEWANLVLELGQICWWKNLCCALGRWVGSRYVGQYERGRLRCIYEKQR